MNTNNEKEIIKFKIIAIIIIALVIILVGGCQDRGKPIQQTQYWESQPFTLTVHLYESSRQISREYHRLYGDDGKERYGFAVWYPNDNECVIHTLELKYQNEKFKMETTGHELYHCIYGSYHPE